MLGVRASLEVFSLTQDTSYDYEIIRKKYIELIEKFPPHLFPKKFAKIRQAYVCLGNHQDYWTEVMEGRHIDIDFLEKENFKFEMVKVRSSQEFFSDYF